jgi:hypothetical protein
MTTDWVAERIAFPLLLARRLDLRCGNKPDPDEHRARDLRARPRLSSSPRPQVQLYPVDDYRPTAGLVLGTHLLG